jgi:hypothetical protein
MNRLGFKRFHHTCDTAAGKDCEANVGIGWARQGSKLSRMNHVHLMAFFTKVLASGLQGADYAIDLRAPGIRDEENAHVSPQRELDARTVSLFH